MWLFLEKNLGSDLQRLVLYKKSVNLILRRHKNQGSLLKIVSTCLVYLNLKANSYNYKNLDLYRIKSNGQRINRGLIKKTISPDYHLINLAIIIMIRENNQIHQNNPEWCETLKNWKIAIRRTFNRLRTTFQI